MSQPLSRALIVRTARDLIVADGLDQLSLRRLASRLGVTAPALYAHVADKDDLLGAVADIAFADLIERYRTIQVTEPGDPVAQLRMFGHAYVDFALECPELFRVMFLFRPLEIDLPTDNVLESASEAFEVPFEAVNDAISSGAVHPDRDALLTALTLWTAVHGAASVLLMSNHFDDATRTGIVDGVIDATLVGMREPPKA